MENRMTIVELGGPQRTAVNEADGEACEAFLQARAINPRFYELLLKMALTHNAKQHDYCGEGNDPLRNLRGSEELGVPAWKGTLIRMADKWARIRNFALAGKLAVKDESFVDTCLDLAVYCLHVIVLFGETHSAPSSS